MVDGLDYETEVESLTTYPRQSGSDLTHPPLRRLSLDTHRIPLSSPASFVLIVEPNPSLL